MCQFEGVLLANEGDFLARLEPLSSASGAVETTSTNGVHSNETDVNKN